MYVCVYICLCVYIYMYLYVCIYLYVYMYIHVCMYIVYHYWLVVSTPLKNISRWNDYSQYMEIRNAPNHQPDYVCLGMDPRERCLVHGYVLGPL